ncbi:MAG: OmpA family protein [Gammaproteobacteria bacterium]|nr:OmpA family protein [Gammaproteobacteria bacterium]
MPSIINLTTLQRFAASLLAAVSLPAYAQQHYEAAIEEVKWTISASAVQCELKQQIPRFGEAVFMHSAGGELSFVVNVDQPPVNDSEALLYSNPPYWKPEVVPRELSRSPLMKGNTPVYFARKVALRMLYELDQGMQPSLHFRDWADETEDVTVAVSTVHFRDFWPEFIDCQTKLLPFGYDDVKNLSMLFDSGSARLRKSSKEMLDRIALYISKDQSVSSVKITGFTDSIGFRYLNQLLSNRRARVVSKYLISKGVPKEKLSISGRGERRPKLSNASIKGRRYNRRVQVQLFR